MTTREARGLPTETIDEESIARYLQLNPDFFERHQAILARMRLPHARSASTISLVERQVEVMRERQAELEGKLADFVRVARANDVLTGKIQRFTRRLLRATSRQDMAAQIEASLREDFDAFHATLILVNGNERGFEGLPERFLRAVSADDPNFKSFEGLFASGKPRCGQVRDTQRQFLFGTDSTEIGSVALVPLGEHGSVGLLALGSHDRERFHPGMSTEFLARMGELIADAVVYR
ncbi:MAG TPA: DUF484 family protein [Steroidobacteraceae bacterium]|nr:DUF484 family protein [Steroidobacteraceae bacterium]HNS26619.1 DUF484 family protein [Steroidobacteraceae bacterium]